MEVYRTVQSTSGASPTTGLPPSWFRFRTATPLCFSCIPVEDVCSRHRQGRNHCVLNVQSPRGLQRAQLAGLFFLLQPKLHARSSKDTRYHPLQGESVCRQSDLEVHDLTCLSQRCRERPRYVENGYVHKFCGKRCAEAPQSGGGAVVLRPNGSNRCLACQRNPVAMGADGVLSLFCGRDCALSVAQA